VLLSCYNSLQFATVVFQVQERDLCLNDVCKRNCDVKTNVLKCMGVHD